MKTSTIRSQIEAEAFRLLKKNTDGMRWSDLNSAIEISEPSFHPKTINGIVWKLPQKYPDKVYKPEKGVFRLLKYKD